MENKKIKEIYHCKYIVSSQKLYPLQRWYNQLIDKSINEITTADVLKMIRQNEFINLATQKAIEFLQYDVFAGELYSGEILEKILEIDDLFLIPYLDDLKTILKKARKESKIHEWSYMEEETEFEKILYIISKKIENIQ